MPLTSDELIEKSKEQRKRKRYEEALVSALAAVEADEDNAEAWWQVSLSRISLGDERNAILALRQTVELWPSADGAWAKLGELLVKADEQGEARDAFIEALDYNPENTEALEGMARIYSDENDKSQDDEEASVLERIERLTYLDRYQKNRVGILHHRNGRPHEAIKYWREAAFGATGPASRFNLGLAYSHDEISQDADAIDMWRVVLDQWPDYEPAQNRIKALLPRLLDLASRVRRHGDSLLPSEQWYEHYLNPFELLNPQDELDFEDFDPKTLQKLKKSLLQEIDLEDGQVSWLPGVSIDKSRAIGLCDELNDDDKRWFHWLVYKNTALLSFLTKGSHAHFLVGESELHLETIEVIEDEDSGFLEWLGVFFAPQFDRVLSRAIDTGNAVVVECLLDGRRWVPASKVDSCFQNARRVVDRLVQPLRNENERADDVKPSFENIEGILNRSSMLAIMNLLPSFFEDFQNQAVHQIRGIAVSCFNSHDDIDLSRKVIELAKRFRFRSAEANKIIEDDVAQIEKLVRQERKHEAKIQVSGKRAEITKEGVRLGEDRFIAASDVSSVKWGALISGERSAPIYDFLVAFGANDGRRIAIQWKSSNDPDGQQKYFQGLIDASYNYIFPSLVTRVEKHLATGAPMTIGPCRVTRHGLHFEVKGWLFSSEHFVSWRRAQVSVENGEVIIRDVHDLSKKTSFSLRETDNAPLLRALINIKNERDN